MPYQIHTNNQYHRSQNNGYAAAPRYRSQSPDDSQHHTASWLSDYISEPVYSDSGDYINPQDPQPSPSPVQYERHSPMSSSLYSPGERGANNHRYYYTSSPYRPQRPAQSRYRTPSPGSDYIAQSARTEDDYIATPAKLMPGAFVDDDTPADNGYAEYGPEDSSPLQHSVPKEYRKETSRSHRRASPKDYDNHRALARRESDYRSSNWDRKHDSLRILSRSRSRNNGLKPHELANFQEAREFLERFRALEIKGARRTAHSDPAYSSDEDRDDRSLRSRRGSSPGDWDHRRILVRQSYDGNAPEDSDMPLSRVPHHYQHGGPSTHRTTRYSPTRQSRLDRYEARPSYHDSRRQITANDSDVASYRSASFSGHVSRAPSTTPSYVSHGPSPTRSYVSRSPSYAGTRRRTARSRSSSDNGIAEGSDYLPSDDEDADRTYFSEDEHRYRSDDNGVGEGDDYLSSGDERERERDDRASRRNEGVRLYPRSGAERDSYPVGIKRGWGS
ncbi:hypothetical protein yc1106_04088 [Curvularia clavata]|uniref:Uncharacterized protein n=1 Tax=Curvularia clavata TaxID=95742 RepID=A0A9Q8Z6B4_CURCL|nr:hypothetical protein yc1106_04088 [Curvularia clavata]